MTKTKSKKTQKKIVNDTLKNINMGDTENKEVSTYVKTVYPTPVILEDEDAHVIIQQLEKEQGLSADQSYFAYIYCMPENKFNAYRAAWLLSGIEDPTEEEKNNLRVKGHNMCKNAYVQKGIDFLLKRRAKNIDVLGEDIIKNLIGIATSNPLNFLEQKDQGVVVKNLEDIPETLKSCIKSIKQKPFRVGEDTVMYLELEFHDKLKAIETLVKMTGLDVATMASVGNDYEEMLARVKGDKTDESIKETS